MEPSLTLAYVLIVAGLLLLVAELFVPSAGVLLVVSLSAIVIGVAMTFPYSDDPTTGVLTLIGVFIAIPLVVGTMLHYWPKTRMGRRFFLNSQDSDATIA